MAPSLSERGSSSRTKPPLDRPMDQSIAGHPDFSPATDLHQVVANIYGLRFTSPAFDSIAILAGAMLVPIVPVVLRAVPADQILADQILAGLKDLLF
jgi:hypothetical protein